MSVTLDTSHSTIGPCGPLEQSSFGDNLRHASTVSLSSDADEKVVIVLVHTVGDRSTRARKHVLSGSFLIYLIIPAKHLLERCSVTNSTFSVGVTSHTIHVTKTHMPRSNTTSPAQAISPAQRNQPMQHIQPSTIQAIQPTQHNTKHIMSNNKNMQSKIIHSTLKVQ